MTEKKYLRLKKLVKKVKSLAEFFEVIGQQSFWYGVPFYSKKDYQMFYERYKVK